MLNSDRVDKILYGGDYNPEQWPEEIWKEDMRLFKKANIDIVTLNVFSWATLQKSDDEYDFTKLDKIMELVAKNKLKVCLATSTGAHPPWMAKKYPEILRVEFDGKKRKFGGRHNSCPNSSVYRKYSTKLAELLAIRYKDYDNIVAWHISNEYGGECYCENCEKSFRIWLKEKYQTIENINKVWNTTFWGHTFYDFDEIVLPNLLSEHFDYNRTQFQGITLDYKRFNSDSILDCYKLEYDAIKKHSDIKITTNMMVTYKHLDYFKWAKELDFISLDSYPNYGASYSEIAFSNNLMRGLKSGEPFMLMEQTPSSTNWQPVNTIKRPNVMRLLSYQAIANGSDSIMFFQMRRSIGACEKFHGAVIDHVGHENTRVFREITKLGEELVKLSDKTLGSKIKSKVGIVFDWDNWWALENTSGPTYRIDYLEEVQNYYKALHKKNIAVDILSVDMDYINYDVIITPTLYMMKGDYHNKLRNFVKSGGTLVTTFLSGIVDENDLVQTGGYPYVIRDLVGVWVEESDDLPMGYENTFTFEDKKYPAKIICDVIHLEGAKDLGKFEDEYYKNYPAVTVNKFEKGKTYYIGTRSNEEFYSNLIDIICNEKNIKPVMEVAEGIEVSIREKSDKRYLFILNHNTKEEEITLQYNCYDLINDKDYKFGDKINLDKYDVLVMEILEVI